MWAAQWLRAVERVVVDGSIDLEACIALMFLEDLQHITSHVEIEVRPEEIEVMLGPRCRSSWNWLMARWQRILDFVEEQGVEVSLTDEQFPALDAAERAASLADDRRTEDGRYPSVADIAVINEIVDPEPKTWRACRAEKALGSQPRRARSPHRS